MAESSGMQPRAAVHDEHDEVGLGDRPLGLVGGGAEQRVVALQEQAAGVDELERRPLPRGLGVVPVAGGARPGVDDGLAAAARSG